MGFTGILEGFLGAHSGFRGEFVPVWVDVFWGCWRRILAAANWGWLPGKQGFFAAWGRIWSEGRKLSRTLPGTVVAWPMARLRDWRYGSGSADTGMFPAFCMVWRSWGGACFRARSALVLPWR